MSKQKSKIFIISLLFIVVVALVICLDGITAKYISDRTIQSNVQVSLLLQGDEGDMYESPVILTSTGAYRLKKETDLSPGDPKSDLVSRYNLYDYVLPGVNIPKDPKVFITKKSGADAYLYIEVIEDNFPKYYTHNGFNELAVDTDNKNNVSPIYYELDDIWVPVIEDDGVTHATGSNGGKLYVYYNQNGYFTDNKYNKSFEIKVATGTEGETFTQNATCLSSYIMKTESDGKIDKQPYYGENKVKMVDGKPIDCPYFNILKNETIYVSEKYIHSEYYSSLYTDLGVKDEKSENMRTGYDFGLYFHSYMASAKINGSYMTPYAAFEGAGFVDENTQFGVGDNMSDCEYTLDESTDSIILNKYVGSNVDAVVASTYKIDGKIYNTSIEAASIFKGNKTIQSVTINEGVKVASNSMAEMFYGCTNLQTADLTGLDTSNVTNFNKLFMECKKMTSVDVTGWDTSSVEDMGYLLDSCESLTTFIGYEDWDTSSVWNIYKLCNKTFKIPKVDLSKWDLSNVDNSGWCFQGCYASEILLPDSLSLISAGFFNHATSYQGATFTVPAGVEKIGYGHTFYDFGTDNLNEFIVAEGNTKYKTIDGILYTADGKELLGIPRGKTFENNTFVIPETVEFMGELSFSRNTNIETVVIPDNFIIEYVPDRSSDYVLQDGHGGNDGGNLNPGNSLGIAIYHYTGITKYDVHDTNTNYDAVNGIIYSKDMTTLVAIPTKYTQKIVIPEGVTTWSKEALWSENNSTVDNLMKNCPGVSIPSTMNDISEDQFQKINRLATKFPSTFVIEVAEGNTVYYVDSGTGLLTKY